MPGNFYFLLMIKSHEKEHKIIYSGLTNSRMDLSNQSDLPAAFFRPRKVNLKRYCDEKIKG